MSASIMNVSEQAFAYVSELQLLLMYVEKDLKKNMLSESINAGIRVRHSLRVLRKVAYDLQKLTVNNDKAVQLARRANRREQ